MAATSLSSPTPRQPPEGGSSVTAAEGHRRLTVTQVEQLQVEAKVAEIFNAVLGVNPSTQSLLLEIYRDQHIEYLTQGLHQLGPNFCVLDSNRPWLCYWIIHSIALLGEELDEELEDDIVQFLFRCQDRNGGYGGGPGQLPHLATTYAAVNTLVTLGTEDALSSINRVTMYQFLLRMKDSSGAFRMHEAGEMDVRACYVAISVASLLNILDSALARGVGNYIARCQTYEGGIAGEPYSEAHGGYTFCGLAAIILIGEAEKLDLPSLIDWIAFRQGVECGFQGRTNKLVDGCYSFWQGGALALTQRLLTIIDEQLNAYTIPSAELLTENASPSMLTGNYTDVGSDFVRRDAQISPLFHNIALQQYILLCSQVLEGGFRDKPGKRRDFYHSCYCLSGLSASQYSSTSSYGSYPPPNAVLGPDSNVLEPIHPLYNILLSKFHIAHKFFSERLE